MPYIDPEVIQKARRVDLLDYLRAYEPYELVRISGNLYTTKTHDSLKISNGKWMWWSRGIGGVNALDYLVKVKGLSFMEAVECLSGRLLDSYTPPPPVQKPIKKELRLPQKNRDTMTAVRYLKNRGIDGEIIDHCLNIGVIYEDARYHSVVFVGYDREGTPKYGAYRGTGEKRSMGDCYGSDKRHSFHLGDTESETVHVFESVIDLLSYATIIKEHGGNWKSSGLFSLSGIYAPEEDDAPMKTPAALAFYLSEYPQTKRIILHLDNDRTGRVATAKLMENLSGEYEVINDPPPRGKDFNDFLCMEKEISIKGREDRKGEER